MYWTVDKLPKEQRIELPVFEDVQAGIATGMTLNGMKICCVYPRFDFMLLAFNQIVNHLDKVEEMSDGMYKPRVIIRVAVGSSKPLMPGPQHCQDYSKELKTMCKNIDVVELRTADMVYEEYSRALNSSRSTILVEYPDIYNQEMTEIFIKSREERK